MKLRFALLAVFLGLICTLNGLAAPLGVLTVTNCTGGGVTVTATSIDWLTPVGGGFGCLVSDTPTLVTYTGGGPLLSGDTTGSIKDLTLGGPPVVIDFMTFSDQPNLHFDLNALPPSPFILTGSATGTTVTLNAGGTARDSSATTSSWSGLYTTQFAGITPAQLLAGIAGATITGPGGVVYCTGGACTNSYSGNFQVNVNAVVPEPVSLLLIAGGLMGLGFLRRLK